MAEVFQNRGEYCCLPEPPKDLTPTVTLSEAKSLLLQVGSDSSLRPDTARRDSFRMTFLVFLHFVPTENVVTAFSFTSLILLLVNFFW